MTSKTKQKRSESEEKEYYKGVIRKKNKRIKLLERENARLTQYLMRDDWEYDWDEEESKLLALKKESFWSCSVCKSTEFSELILPLRKYITCDSCGKRTKVVIDAMDSVGK